MHARLLLCSVLLGAAACLGADEDTTANVNTREAPDGVTQGLGNQHPDAGAACGRTYPVTKDNRTPQHPADDVELIDTLVPHHQMAVHMAELELERGADAEVKEMAAKVKRDQTEEIAKLLHIRGELTGCTSVTPFPDPHMEEEMKIMMGLSGSALDLKFVEDMIPHHAGALQFTHYALPKLRHHELKAIAHEVIDAQAMEVGELHEMKKRLVAGAHGSDAGISTGTPAPCSSDADCGHRKCVSRPAGHFCDVPEMVVGHGGHAAPYGH